jgi:hypothetical protein
MKNIKRLSYAAAVILIATATSCKKQLEEVNPHSPTAENQYNTPAGFTTLVNMCYQDLHQIYGIEDGLFLCESGTDLWYNDGRGGYASGITQYLALSSAKPNQPKSHWTACYRGINYCNTGIDLIDKAGYTNEADKNARLGELRFLRALYYYHIVEQFGAAPLNITSSSSNVDISPTRSSPEDIYAVMIDDLNFAKDNLPVKQPDAEYSRASKKSALGLLARVLLTRAYYATGAEATNYFTQAKNIAEQVINNQTSLGVSLYQGDYAQVGASVYGSTAARAANKEAMFVLAYNEAYPSQNAYVTKNGNRIFKWTLPKYTSRPGMSTAYVYGVDNEQRLMPTWHLLDLFDETMDARYNADFQELWIANQAWTWTSSNLSDNQKLKYRKGSTVVGSTINVGDTAMFFTKKSWGGRLTRTYLEMDRDDLYQNPQHGQGAGIYNNPDSNVYITTCYPAFKKFVNPHPTSTTATTDFGDAMIIRLAEMYLIAAEASVQLGQPGTAAQWINEIRKRAAIPGHEADMQVSAADMNINFILDERAREFVGEEQRWYDLKRVFRTGEDWAAYILKYNPDLTNIQPFHRLRPIPLLQLQTILNPKEFGQNPGYDQP